MFYFDQLFQFRLLLKDLSRLLRGNIRLFYHQVEHLLSRHLEYPFILGHVFFPQVAATLCMMVDFLLSLLGLPQSELLES